MSEVRFWEKGFVIEVYKQAVYWSLSGATPLGMGKKQDCSEGSGTGAGKAAVTLPERRNWDGPLVAPH